MFNENERYKLALHLASKEIASLRYLLHDDDLDEGIIKNIEDKFLLLAQK